MLGKLLRVLLALTAVAPIFISLAYILASHSKKIFLAVLSLLFCIFLGFIAVTIIKKSQEKLEKLPITITKAKSADKEVIGFFAAYALPLLFRGHAVPDIGAWVIAILMLIFVLWTTHALQVNPVLGLFGYHFYEVETENGISYLMITDRKINNIQSIKNVIQLSEYGVLEAK